MPSTTLNATRFVKVLSGSPSTSYASASSQDRGTLIMQFTLPTAAAEGVITNARLKFSYQGSLVIIRDLEYRYYSAWTESGASVACYKTSDTTTALTYNNYETVGSVSASQSLGISHSGEPYSRYSVDGKIYSEYSYHSGSINADVAGLINGNIVNNVVGFVISGTSGRAASSTTDITTQASSFSNVSLEITYEAPSAKTPTISFPSNVYIKQGTQINLSWLYNASGSATQSSAIVEYHDSTTSTFTAVTITGTGTTYTIPVTLSQGLVTWRVKTTDSNGNTSDYATATFTIIGKPQAPTINDPANSALTTISWTSAEQLSYKLALYSGDTLIDSVEGSDDRRTYLPNMFLANGSYTFKIAVSNSAGIWSDEATKVFAISVTAPSSSAKIGSVSTSNVVKLNSITNVGSNTAYVVRNGQIIGKVEGTSFTDKEVAPNRSYVYALRIYDGAGYVDKGARTVTVNFKGCYLTSGSTTLHLLYSEQNFMPLNDKPTHTKAIISYVGRSYPIAEIGTEKSRSITRQCVLTSVADYESLLALEAEKDLIYQGAEGLACHVTITDITTSRYMDKGFVVQITMQQVDSEPFQIGV